MSIGTDLTTVIVLLAAIFVITVAHVWRHWT
jgi:hypothetical protein